MRLWKMSLRKSQNAFITGVGAKIADSVKRGSSSFIEYLADVFCDSTFNFHCVNQQTVFNMLHSIFASKATGIDQIPGKILKLAASAITQSLIMLFNCSIATDQEIRDQEIYLITTPYFYLASDK